MNNDDYPKRCSNINMYLTWEEYIIKKNRARKHKNSTHLVVTVPSDTLVTKTCKQHTYKPQRTERPIAYPIPILKQILESNPHSKYTLNPYLRQSNTQPERKNNETSQTIF